MKNLIALTLTALFLASPAFAAKTTKKPTALPAYKGKTKVSIDFQPTPTPSDDGVVLVAEPVENDVSQVRVLRKETQAQAPTPAPTPTPAPAPAPKIDFSLKAALKATPQPTTEPTPVAAAFIANPVTPEPSIEVQKMQAYDVAPSQPANLPVKVPPTTATTEATPVPTSDFEDRSGQPVFATPASATAAATIIAPVSETSRVFLFEGGYLDARYDRLESDLKDGASTMSLSFGLPMETYEVRGTFDVAHGLDQSVTPQNTRMLSARGGAYKFLGGNRVKFLGGASVGVAGIDVRSYREVTKDEFTVRQHAIGTVMTIVPEIDARMQLGSRAVLQLGVRYWALTGASDLAKLGGFAGTLGAGYEF